MATFSTAAEAAELFKANLVKLLSDERGVDPNIIDNSHEESIPTALSCVSGALRKASRIFEADALDQVYDKVTQSPSFGGLGLSSNYAVPTTTQYEEAVFLCEAWLESVKSQERAKDFIAVNDWPVQGAKPMTLAQKIFTQHALSSKAEHGLSLGDVVRVGVDWILASELSVSSIENAYLLLGLLYLTHTRRDVVVKGYYSSSQSNRTLSNIVI